MEPRISKRNKKVHLSYELPHRIHSSRIYPFIAPNGSTLILYGHDRGLRVLWRGGRRPKENVSTSASSRTTRSQRRQDVRMNGDSDRHAASTNGGGYESQEEEQDPDCPFPSIIQDVDIDLGTEVVCLAVPSYNSLPPADIPPLAHSHAIAAVACSNNKVLLLSLPLAPPTSVGAQSFVEEEVDVIELEGDGAVAHDLALKVVSKEAEISLLGLEMSKASQDAAHGRLLVAATAIGLNVWSPKLTPSSISTAEDELRSIVRSPETGSKVAFHPSPRSSQLLLADRSGTVRIYDALAPAEPGRPVTTHAQPSVLLFDPDNVGKWVVSYHSPFQAESSSPSLARRKRILSAAWVFGGRGILSLLEDGEWGIWDLAGSSRPGKSLQDFALRGYLGSSSATDHIETGKQKKTGSKLAPMTPNTRAAKAENLFGGPPRPAGIAATGGISISTSIDRSGKMDESVALWYNGDVYSIASMQTFWQRSTSTSGGFGSLYVPGLTHITDINLMNENITSISQFAPHNTTATNLGQMNIQQDLLVSAEHRFVILQSLRPQVPTKRLFQQELAERPAQLDQRMLDAGELDINSMDRILDGMVGDGRSKRVGFAQ